jgi:hypothetical protein
LFAPSLFVVIFVSFTLILGSTFLHSKHSGKIKKGKEFFKFKFLCIQMFNYVVWFSQDDRLYQIVWFLMISFFIIFMILVHIKIGANKKNFFFGFTRLLWGLNQFPYFVCTKNNISCTNIYIWHKWSICEAMLHFRKQNGVKIENRRKTLIF